MAGTPKILLPNTETEIFYNWDDTGRQVIAKNITLCNTSNATVKVHLSFCVISGDFRAGAVLSYTDILPYETRTIEITPRIVNMDESIRAYAEVPNVIALSIDLEGVDIDYDFNPIL